MLVSLTKKEKKSIISPPASLDFSGFNFFSAPLLVHSIKLFYLTFNGFASTFLMSWEPVFLSSESKV